MAAGGDEPNEAEFQLASYWDKFYGDEDEGLFDWYSAAEFLEDTTEFVARQMAGSQEAAAGLRIADLGCGTSPLLFGLHARGFRNLDGVDFASAPIAVAEQHRDEEGISKEELRFHVADVTRMPMLETASCAVVLDKGCLDCFVSAKDAGAITRVAAYLEEVARVLAPSGRFVLVPANASDIPTLFATGVVIFDHASRVASGSDALAASWEAAKLQSLTGSATWVRRFVLEEVRTRDGKHLFVFRPVEGSPSLEDAPMRPATIACDLCNDTFAYPDTPERCEACFTSLRRFCVS